MSDKPVSIQDPLDEPKNIRFLRRLVTTLTLVLIIGVITVVVLLVTRLSNIPSTNPAIATESINIPDGYHTKAFTKGSNWTAVVVADKNGVEKILIYELDGSLRQEIGISQP